MPADDASDDALTDNWPIPLIGRERELAMAQAALARPEVRLLTLTGPAGVGKTRLAIEVARAVGGSFPDGMVVVPLAAVADPAFVLPTITRALGVADDGSPPIERLGARLGDSRRLLLLDNLEHVLAAANDIVHLLDRCPRLTVLATSRAALGVGAEHPYPVGPLAVPRPLRR